MAEVAEESTHVWSAKQRIAVFMSAMRHFADEIRERGLPLELGKVITQLQPAALVLTAPG
ncbi:MAG: cryptochrome/photolyase family protein, partial [Rhodoferax sp.]|uniref:cryptochrome/photolyase family protein n=1 Tax=Rhodoferax sp. TaxID=50421 RepID=UPI0030188F6D